MTALETISDLQARMGESIIGQQEVIERLIIGLLANGNRVHNITKARELLAVPEPDDGAEDNDDQTPNICPCCGGRMITIETFEPGCTPRQAPPPDGIDSS